MRDKFSCSTRSRHIHSEFKNVLIASLGINAARNMETKKTIGLSVKVHPRSRKQEIIELGENTYIIHVKSSPSKGEANQEVKKLVAKFFAVPVSKVKISRGHKSRNKLITIQYD